MQLQMLAGSYAWTGEADPIRYYRTPILGYFFRRRVARCIELLPGGNRVLEVGYGSGISFLSLAQRYREIHGIDVHDRIEEVARAFRDSGLIPRLKQGSVTQLPYDDATFDAVLAISVHEELSPAHQHAAFSEVRRVLKPGGHYVVGVPGVNWLMNAALYAIGCDAAKYHITTDAEVLAVMKKHFAIEKVRYCPSLWPKSLTTYVCIKGAKAPV